MAVETALLTSAKNPLLKDVRRAVARGSLTDEGLAVAEGFHLLEEAIRSESRIHAILAARSVQSVVRSHVRGLRRQTVTVIDDAAFAQLSSTEATQGVITLIEPPSWTIDNLFRGQSMIVVLDGIQDPGNAGAIVRGAEAFGATGVVFVKGCVSPHNPKTLRASAGSLFRLPIATGLDEEMTRAALEQHRLDIYGAAPRGSKSIADAELWRRFAVIIGSEGRGVSPRLRGSALDLRIPTVAVESLNAAVATGIILYEAARQRTLHR